MRKAADERPGQSSPWATQPRGSQEWTCRQPHREPRPQPQHAGTVESNSFQGSELDCANGGRNEHVSSHQPSGQSPLPVPPDRVKAKPLRWPGACLTRPLLAALIPLPSPPRPLPSGHTDPLAVPGNTRSTHPRAFAQPFPLLGKLLPQKVSGWFLSVAFAGRPL